MKKYRTLNINWKQVLGPEFIDYDEDGPIQDAPAKKSLAVVSRRLAEAMKAERPSSGDAESKGRISNQVLRDIGQFAGHKKNMHRLSQFKKKYPTSASFRRKEKARKR